MDFAFEAEGNITNNDAENTENINFVIDTFGNKEKIDSECKTHLVNPRLEELFKDFDHIFEKPKKPERKVSPKDPLVTEILADLGVNGDGTLKKKTTKPKSGLLNVAERTNMKAVLEKSIITPEFKTLHVVPSLAVSEKKLKQQRKKERDLTKGQNWYGLPATELTCEVKRDLQVLQMRSILDPKHFYKKNDLKVLPKYFQIGKVMDSPLNFYNDRVPKKQRKKTLVDELLADAEFNKYNKRKYKEIIVEKQKSHYKAWRQAKRLKKNK